MAGQARALSAGTMPRRRVLFGLLDADGWSWATVKAFFWFVVMILLLAYLPDRAYYFTVFSTIDLGINAVSPINLCPPENRNLPCPAPVGAAIPWDQSPSQLRLPGPRTDGEAVTAGVKILYIGGNDGKAASDKVFVADAFTTGNFSPWKDGPALPEPRSKPAVVFLAGSIYAAGGADASDKPTKTVYVLTPNAQSGDLGTWATGPALPEARTGSSLLAISDGLLLLGGRDDSGKPTNTVWKATLDSKGKLGDWKPNAPMEVPGSGGANQPAPRADATAALSGTSVYVYGGVDASGPTTQVLLGQIATVDTVATATRWGGSVGASNLPEPRTDAAGFTANGVLYLVGGTDGKTPRGEMYWAVPDSTGVIPEWKHLPQSDLPAQGLSGSAAVVSGSSAFVIGGQTSQGLIDGAARANLAPQPPFFQLGLLGATVPALKIDGEVGQQLGYIAAAVVFTGNFVLLIVIGWAMAHREQVRGMMERVRARRRRAE